MAGKILITGASGLIGRRLLAGGDSRLCALLRAPLTDIPDDAAVIGDLADPALAGRLPAGVESIVHLAQSRAYNDFPGKALDVFDVNVAGTARLLDWARRSGVKRVVLASTGGLYAPGPHAHTEDEPVAPAGRLAYYYATRRSAELLAESYTPFFTVIVLRFFFVYGPNQPASMLVPRLVRAVRQGEPLQLQGTDGMRFNPVHVDDAAGAILAALEQDRSGAFNVAGPQVLSMRRAGEIIGARLGVAARFDCSPGAVPTDLVGDIKRMAADLRAPRIGFEEGLATVTGSADT